MAVRRRRIANIVSSCEVAWLSQVHDSLFVWCPEVSASGWFPIRCALGGWAIELGENGLSGGGSVLYAIQSRLGLCFVSGRNVDSSRSDRWSRNCLTLVPAASSDRVYPNLAAARVFWSYFRVQPTECHPPAWLQTLVSASGSTELKIDSCRASDNPLRFCHFTEVFH